MSPSRMSTSPMMNSPSGKHIGVLPAQQPADCTNITGAPRAARRRLIASRAAGVAEMRAGLAVSVIPRPLEEAERLGAVTHQQVLRLAVVVEHHRVVLPADAGDLVPTERCARRIGVVAVRPDAPSLDLASHLVG